ncbi:hypothetical protein EJ06DRAFT_530248 [Trichodelitschia bisporula]|uniref:Uncharacterized protein n=1 Tax=Trichodelitschia bisporula TaxID=703511 RepID=A0A6G1HWL3_9PEZI|nr:hypothetical protein EJ06DRAFT_530248 [Trichodelitschia bisporula]
MKLLTVALLLTTALAAPQVGIQAGNPFLGSVSVGPSGASYSLPKPTPFGQASGPAVSVGNPFLGSFQAGPTGVTVKAPQPPQPTGFLNPLAPPAPAPAPGAWGQAPAPPGAWGGSPQPPPGAWKGTKA